MQDLEVTSSTSWWRYGSTGRTGHGDEKGTESRRKWATEGMAHGKIMWSGRGHSKDIQERNQKKGGTAFSLGYNSYFLFFF